MAFLLHDGWLVKNGESVTFNAETLSQTLPAVIPTDRQNEEYAARLEELVFKGMLTPAEEQLAELLALLVEEYEERRFPIASATPTEVLAELIAANNLKQKDLTEIFGAESTVSSVLRGKREMTKEHIKKLSDRFGVSPAVFF